MSPLLDLQVRFRELGRIRAGEKGAKGEPKKRTTWRLTSASRKLLEVGQREYGGELRPWENAPNEGMWELLTDTAELDVMIPPVSDASTLLTQHYELWSGGGCKRRCDSVTQENGKPCACNPEARECKPTTRLSVMLPRIPDIGVWRIDSLGINVALEMPGTFGLLVQAANGNFLPASLRLEQRTSKKEGEPTRRFVVPVLEMPFAGVGALAEAAAGGKPMLLESSFANGKPELPAAAPPPDVAFTHDEKPGFGAPPALPDASPAGEPETGESFPPAASSEDVSQAERVLESASPAAPLMTPAKKRKLDILVGKLRDGGHITTEQIYKRCRIEPLPTDYDNEGVLHYAPLRDRLSRSFGDGLIDALTKLETSVAGGSYDFEGRAAEVQAARTAGS